MDMEDYPDDDGGMSDCEAFEWYFEQAQLLLAADPKYVEWLDYVNEQRTH